MDDNKNMSDDKNLNHGKSMNHLNPVRVFADPFQAHSGNLGPAL
jgi:hypothetical protein